MPFGSVMRTIASFAVALAVVMAGCSQGESATNQFSVLGGDDYSFTPRVVTVPRDTPLTLTFRAEGTDHTYVVKDAIQDGPIDTSDGLLTRRPTGPNDLIVAEANVGETVTATFTMAERGVYLVYCMLPDHRENGMFGTLIVD